VAVIVIQWQLFRYYYSRLRLLLRVASMETTTLL
jgi:hypothetical protein